MRHENAARFSNLRQEKGCALLLNPKDSSSQGWRKGGFITVNSLTPIIHLRTF